MQTAQKLSSQPLLNFPQLAGARPETQPYPHMLTAAVLSPHDADMLARDFPDIREPGFFPLPLLERKGAFDALIGELEGPEIANILSEKLGLDLHNKPRMITIRKWSAGNDGRIHNDGEAKICTSLLYLNPTWPPDSAGCLRVLNGPGDFDDYTTEVPPTYGTFFAFKRTENSWHGHKPFTGERRVIQVTWLRSWDDYHRKQKRGKLSFILKKILPGFKGGEY